MLNYNDRPRTQLTANASALLDLAKSSKTIVLVGPNNCGKSFLLKCIAEALGTDARYLGPARYQNFQVLNSSDTSSKQDRKHQYKISFLDQLGSSGQNNDTSHFSLQQQVAWLSDEARAKFCLVMEELVGYPVEVKHIDPKNSMSPFYVSVGGHNLSYSSSGYRLVATLMTSLLDTDYSAVLIDEPELGISPELQHRLAALLHSSTYREKELAHLKTIAIATHSTAFLDRSNVENNFFVTRDRDVVDATSAKSQQDYNRMHFFLLGNRMDSLYLPSAILVVEGSTDATFIRSVVSAEFKNDRISIVESGGDGGVKSVITKAREILGDLSRSPFRDRLYIVLDKVHDQKVSDWLSRQGVAPSNIVIWNNNGIEFLYPPAAMRRVYSRDRVDEINGNEVFIGGEQYPKVEVARSIAQNIMCGDEHLPELREKLLDPLRKLLSQSS